MINLRIIFLGESKADIYIYFFLFNDRYIQHVACEIFFSLSQEATKRTKEKISFNFFYFRRFYAAIFLKEKKNYKIFTIMLV